MDDRSLTLFINKVSACPFLDRVMPVLTDLGGGLTLFFLALLILICGRRTRRAGILILAGLTIAYYVVSFLKEGVARPRPFIALPEIRSLVAEKGFSFPSYHATAAFMTAAILAAFYRFRALFFALALFVAFSRIYIGVHYLADVAAGALLGITLGLLLVYLDRLITRDQQR